MRKNNNKMIGLDGLKYHNTAIQRTDGVATPRLVHIGFRSDCSHRKLTKRLTGVLPYTKKVS